MLLYALLYCPFTQIHAQYLFFSRIIFTSLVMFIGLFCQYTLANILWQYTLAIQFCCFVLYWSRDPGVPWLQMLLFCWCDAPCAALKAAVPCTLTCQQHWSAVSCPSPVGHYWNAFQSWKTPGDRSWKCRLLGDWCALGLWCGRKEGLAHAVCCVWVHTQAAQDRLLQSFSIHLQTLFHGNADLVCLSWISSQSLSRAGVQWWISYPSLQREKGVSEMANIFFWLCKSSVSVFVHWPVPPCSCPLPVGGSGLQGLSRAAPAASQAHLEQVLCKYPFAHLILRFSIERCLFHLEQPIVVASLTIFWISFLNAISFEWWHQCLER